MQFRIATTVSPDFADGTRLFLPSWLRNSGAESIDVQQATGATWYENIIQRNINLRRSVLAAVRDGVGLLALDLDCFIVRDVSGGFDGVHPIAVARWPLPNMGVAFFDCRLAFEWERMLNLLIVRVTRRCRDPKTWGNEQLKGRFGDQYPWRDTLHEQDGAVRKLDMAEWNFCFQPEDWAHELAKHQERIRIIHVKGRGRWEEQSHIRGKLELVRRAFPDQIQE